MNKQDRALALSVLATLTSALALIYTLIMFHYIFAIIGFSLIFLVCAYILTENLIAFSHRRNQALQQQLRNDMHGISSQLETIGSAQAKIDKATYLYTKQTAETVAALENNYADSQRALYKNLASLFDVQKKSTKLLIKYEQNNATKIVSSIKETKNQLSDTLIQGFDQIQPDSGEIVSLLKDLIQYLKTQPDVTAQAAPQLNELAQELQDMSDSFTPTFTVVENPAQPEEDAENIEENAEESVEESTGESVGENETENKEENTIEFAEMTAESDEDIATASDSNNASPAASEPDLNKQLSPDEIAALFAAAEPAPKKPVVEAPPADDPNKQLSPEEIAALFSSLG